jgi:hypothetical protein
MELNSFHGKQNLSKLSKQLEGMAYHEIGTLTLSLSPIIYFSHE